VQLLTHLTDAKKPQSESPLRRRYKASERSAQQLSQELGAGRLGLEFETLEKRASPCLSAASKSGGSSCSAMKLGVHKVRTYKQNRTLAAARASSILSFHFAPALMLVSSQTASFLRTRGRLESFQPLSVLVAVADEDLVSRGLRHSGLRGFMGGLLLPLLILLLLP
jgi:hypothetical protein